VTLQKQDQRIAKTWQAPKLTHLGELDSHTGAAQVSTDDGPSGSGSIGGDSDTTS
jgi:hypothetical protein